MMRLNGNEEEIDLGDAAYEEREDRVNEELDCLYSLDEAKLYQLLTL